jgi:Domain of unknown function (DUF6249)
VTTFGPYAAVIAFWIFLAVATVAGIIGDYKKRRMELEPLRLALERGHPVDPAVVDKLLYRGRQDKLDPMLIHVGGIITIAAGVGVGLLSYFVDPLFPQARRPLIGLGILAVCVGIGLLIAGRSLSKAA